MSVTPAPAQRRQAAHDSAKRHDRARQADQRSAALRRAVAYLRNCDRYEFEPASTSLGQAFRQEPAVAAYLSAAGPRREQGQLESLLDAAQDCYDEEHDALLALYESTVASPVWPTLTSRQKALFRILIGLALADGPRVLLSYRAAAAILQLLGDGTAASSQVRRNVAQRLQSLGLLETIDGKSARPGTGRARSTVFDLTPVLTRTVLEPSHRARLEALVRLPDEVYVLAGVQVPRGEVERAQSAQRSLPQAASGSRQAWLGGTGDPVLDDLLAASSGPGMARLEGHKAP